MTIQTNIPIWGRLYPDLLDADKVMSAYQQGRTQVKAAEIFGCCDRTFRKALKYHHIYPPLGKVPEHIARVFSFTDWQSENSTHKGI